MAKSEKSGENENLGSSSNTKTSEIFKRTLSASMGAFLTSLVVTPFDVVKVRMQAEPATKVTSLKSSSNGYVFSSSLYDHVEPCPVCSTSSIKCRNGIKISQRGTLQGILDIRRQEGVVALYRGFLPTMFMSVPATVIYFVGYEALRDRVESPMLAGAGARILAVTTISPLELLRTRMQYRGVKGGSLPNVTKEIVELMRFQGAKVLWRGLVPTLCRDVPFSGIYWTAIESFRPRIYDMIPAQDDSALKRFGANFAAGAMAGSIAATLTVPFDVAKTRYQVNNNGDNYSLPRTLMGIWREEGIRGLTAGIVPRVVKVAPACAIMLSSYELGKLLLSNK